MQKIEERLTDKSKEAFLLAIEIYNKPTIRYRVEGFAMFICNAWELMLKAKLINDGKSIYYSDKPERTLGLSDVLRIIYTDKNQPLRVNLEKILDLRNTSTHFITEDYETIYVPLFQACVINYVNEIKRFHNVDITQYIPQNFLTLSAKIEDLTENDIKLKYDAKTAERLLFTKNDIDITSDFEPSEKFAILVKHEMAITRSRNKADFTIAIDNNSKNKAAIIKDFKNPNDTHPYTFNNLQKDIARRIKNNKIPFEYNVGDKCKTIFSTHCLTLFIRFYDLKNNSKYAYKHIFGTNETYTYSQQTAEFIVEEVGKDPKGVIEKLKNKITPGT
jgi:Protein of unknown function (DUF3644).